MAPVDRLAARRRAIFASCRQLGIGDEERRNILRSVAGVSSTSALDLDKAEAVLEHLRRAGAKRPAKAVGRYPNTPKNLDRRAMLQKIEALLADMKLSWAYANAIAERQTLASGAIPYLGWVPDKDLVGVIAALDRKKKKQLEIMRGDMDRHLRTVGLTREDARQHAIKMGRLSSPWPWLECLETLQMIIDEVRVWPN